MKQLTLRGFDPELSARLLQLARERSISLNRAALLLMRRGAGLAASPRSEAGAAIDRGLDRFVGVWSQDEERQFLRAIEDFGRIDSELWE